ncbi:MAG TPA: glucosyl-3-phosphoglycerate synthase [Actinobacteria bacterium]|nr:glucosyl-3-phosphoglycerate synthase [Actinomycetota bacterium]
MHGKENRILLPMTKKTMSKEIIKVAASLISKKQGKLIALGVVEIPEDVSLSYGAIPARRFRKIVHDLAETGECEKVEMKTLVGVSRKAWQEVVDVAQREKCNLIFFEWDGRFDGRRGFLRTNLEQIVLETSSDVAIIKPGKGKEFKKILVLLRGGPHAKLVLSLANSLADKFDSSITILHISSPAPEQSKKDEKNLKSYLRKHADFLNKIEIVSISSPNAVETVLSFAKDYDVVLMGASTTDKQTSPLGLISQKIAAKLDATVIIAMTGIPSKVPIFESEKNAVTIHPKKEDISEIVDRWFAENTFHADEFSDIASLVELKKKRKLTISLGLPTLNEGETIGEILKTLKDELYDKYPLLDEIALIDSNSTDGTQEIARDLGIPVYIDNEILPSQGINRGKGEALWKSLYALNGDIIVWIDTDIKNITPSFVYGLVAPLLKYPRIKYVKGFYRRPLKVGDTLRETGGGRVTELTARPLINLFFPELSGLVQPLSGEYAGRREVLERVGFYTGYGVEIGLLINILEKFGLSVFGQVDLIKRVHRNQSLSALSKMSFAIIQVVIEWLEKKNKVYLLQEINKSMKLIHHEPKNFYLEVREIGDTMRPPMIEVPEYVEKFKK